MKRLIALSLIATASGANAGTLYVRAGAVVDVEKGVTRPNQCITVEDDRIKTVDRCGKAPAGAVVVDWRRYTVLPGLIDLHTHLADVGQGADVAEPIKTDPVKTAFIGAKNARDTLMAGFTTVRDVGTYRAFSDVALRDAINAGLIPGPRMAVAGAYLTIPGGGGEINGLPYAVPDEMRFGVAKTEAEAREKAAAILDTKADFLKLIATGAVLALNTEPGQPELTEGQMRAAVEEAAKRGTYATAHAHGADGIKAAIRAGVRSIEHASLIDDEALALAKAKGVWLVMDVFNGDYIEEVGTKEHWPADYLRKNRETTDIQREGFRKAVQMGVKLAFGSDSGVYPHGMNGRQFAYMVKYGMTPGQAIRAATLDAATVMGWQDKLGTMETGRFADMIAVEGNPLTNVRVLERVQGVIKGGVVVK